MAFPFFKGPRGCLDLRPFVLAGGHPERKPPMTANEHQDFRRPTTWKGMAGHYNSLFPFAWMGVRLRLGLGRLP